MKISGKNWLILFVALLTLNLVNYCLCQEVTFQSDRAMETIRTIASDQFEGRQSGIKGGEMVEEWMAQAIEDIGLEPGGSEGYFQPFPIISSREKSASLTLLDSPLGKISFTYGDDFTLVTHSGSGTVTSEVIVVGHGISKPEKGWDDYGEIDVEGKIVMIFRGRPPVGDEDDWWDEYSRSYTVNEAYSRGAAAVLYVPTKKPIQGGAISKKSYHEDLPVCYVRERVADLLMHDTGWKVSMYRDSLKVAPLVMHTGKRMKISTRVKTDLEGTARNVMGWIRGSDPELSQEVIVVGAHMDHVGKNGDGVIYNGADDNASGSAVILELARCFAEGDPPKRSILFQWYAGEEQGLLGSKYWVKNPTVELENIIGMLNLDMEGRGNGTVGIGGGEYYLDVWEEFVSNLDSTQQENLQYYRSWRGGSDHSAFLRKDIAAFPINTRGGHPLYHVLDDDPRWMQPEVIQSVGGITLTWLRTLANWEQPLRDNYLPERMKWTHNYQIRQHVTNQVNLDSMSVIFEADRNASIPIHWLWYHQTDSTSISEDVVRWADSWRTKLEDIEEVGWVLNQEETEEQADDRKTAVMLGIYDVDVLPDIQGLRILRNLGVGLIRITDPRLWMTEDQAEIDTNIKEEITEGKWWVIAPPGEDHLLISLIDEFRSSVLLWGDPETFDLMDTTTVDSLTAWSGLTALNWSPNDTLAIKEFLPNLTPKKVHLNLHPDSYDSLYGNPDWILQKIQDFGELPDSTWTWEDVLGGNLVR